MTFQILSLPYDPFAHLFGLGDQELAEIHATRSIVSETLGTPCRVSLQDAEVGETVVLVNWEHQSADTPYKSRHAIFVRENASEATPAPDEVPRFLRHRTLSLRAFTTDGMMTDAVVVEGANLETGLAALFERSHAAEIHIHFAAPGCFAARAVPA